MKKILTAIMLLSIAGIVLSAYLVIKHYNPLFAQDLISCGTGCTSLMYSKYSTIFNIPVATLGLIFYIFIFSTLIIALFAEGKYIQYCTAIITPVAIIGLLVDLFLFGIIVYSSYYCVICITTYIINILILILCLKGIKKIKAENSLSLKDIYRETFSLSEDNPDKVAASLLYIMFTFLLVVFTFMASTRGGQSNIKSRPGKSNFVENFFKKPVEKLDLPQSKITLGNPDAPVKIVAFTDFFCSACKNFYKAEKTLLKKYKNKIFVAYYNFPLNGPCVNNPRRRKSDPKSCIAASAMISASEQGILEKYMENHYADYRNLMKNYSKKSALKIIPSGSDPSEFKKTLNSAETLEYIKRDLKLADDLNIHRVPTLFINGRKIVGVPYTDYLEKIIKKEIENNSK